MAAPLFYGAMHYEHQTPSSATWECTNLTYMDGMEMPKGAIKLLGAVRIARCSRSVCMCYVATDAPFQYQY